MKILISISYGLTLPVPSGAYGEHQIMTEPRASDWGKRGVRKYIHHVVESVRITARARNFDAVVLCTVGIEAFVVAFLRPFICPATRLICADMLMPRENTVIALCRRYLKRCDAFACIRSGDIAILERRFGVSSRKCRFVYFPIDAAAVSLRTSDGDYIYSAGFAHRDWPTLVEALSNLTYKAKLTTEAIVELREKMRSRVDVLPALSPEAGRSLMADARIVVLSMEDTDLPSGPLVLLDAMAMGKAVVATAVNGTRDYVRDGLTGLLVPPHDPQRMAEAIELLMSDQDLRRRLGDAARQDVLERFTLAGFTRGIVNLCEDAQRQ